MTKIRFHLLTGIAMALSAISASATAQTVATVPSGMMSLTITSRPDELPQHPADPRPHIY